MRTTIRSAACVVSALAVGLLASTPSAADAQACFPYHTCSIDGMPGDYLGQGPSPYGTHAEPTFWHSNCRICGFGPCHYTCGSGGGGDFEEDAYPEVVEAFGDRDLPRILACARAGGAKVFWNPERSAVQLRSCSGEAVVATLTVADPDVAYVRAAVNAWSEIEP